MITLVSAIKWPGAVGAARAVAHGGISSMSKAKATHALCALLARPSACLPRQNPRGGHHG